MIDGMPLPTDTMRPPHRLCTESGRTEQESACLIAHAIIFQFHGQPRAATMSADTGVFDPTASGVDGPAWTVSSTGPLKPAVITSDTLDVGGTAVTLNPYDGGYFAVIPAGVFLFA